MMMNTWNTDCNATTKPLRPVSCISKTMSAIDLDYSPMPESGRHSLCLRIGYERDLRLTYKSGKTVLYMSFEGRYQNDCCFTIGLEQYAKLMSIRDEIDSTLFRYCNAAYEDTYCRHLGRNLYVKIYTNHGGIQLTHYNDCNNTLTKDQNVIELCHAEWIFMNMSYPEVCQFIPQISIMRKCIDKHTLPDGSLSCEFN